MTTIARPRKFQGPNREYIKVDLEGTVHNVVLDEEVLKHWAEIDTLTIGMVKYTKMRDPDDPDKLIDQDWERPEVIDFVDVSEYTRLGKIAEAKAKYELVTAKVKKEFKLEDAVEAIA